MRFAAWLIIFAAICGLAVWSWPSASPRRTPGPAITDPAPVRMPSAAAVGRPTYPGGVPPVDVASLTPGERKALADREARISAAAAPVAVGKGIDGKPRAFQYPGTQQAVVAERNRQARRERLMVELEADPAHFARAHQLSLDDVRWIVEGETDFPDRLLEP
jgi:hypothetical protein